MPQWKAFVQEIGGAGEVWHTDVKAESETEALRKALEIFLNTEDRYGMALDFTTLTMLRCRGPKWKWRLSSAQASCPHELATVLAAVYLVSPLLRDLVEGTK